MTDTVHLGLPTIEGAQAQKHVTHNEALVVLDALMMLAVIDRDLSSPPGSPGEGDRYLVKSPGSGAFAGKDDQVAHYVDGGWTFYAPQIGWICYVGDEAKLVAWDGASWQVVSGDTITELQNLARLGVGTTADATNPFAAKLNNALWVAKTVGEGGDGDLRYKLSKESAAKTLSLLFQTAFSGRAEIGLTGDDDFHFKVSPDGAIWYEGIRINRTTGAVVCPQGITGVRPQLTASRTYYVRTDGSDSNDGSANDAAHAFATGQKAIDVATSLDLSLYSVTIQFVDGTYTGTLALKSFIGVGPIIIQGNPTTPANVLISVTNGFCVVAGAVRGTYNLNGFKLQTNTAGYNCIIASQGTVLNLSNIHFGPAGSGGIHVSATYGAQIFINTNYTISGGAAVHWYSTTQALIQAAGKTITLTGTPAFTTDFAHAQQGGGILANGNTFVGGATGPRYYTDSIGWIDSLGGGASYLPGNAAGSGPNYF
jgi:hypothetical protein